MEPEGVAKEELVAIVGREGERATNIAVDRKRGYVYVLAVGYHHLSTPVALYRVSLPMNESRWNAVLVTMKPFNTWPPGLAGICASYMGCSLTEEVVRRDLLMDDKCLDNLELFHSAPRKMVIHPPSGDIILYLRIFHEERTPLARIRVSTGEFWLLEADGYHFTDCGVAEDGAGRLLAPMCNSEIVLYDDRKGVALLDISMPYIDPFYTSLVFSPLEQGFPDGCFVMYELVEANPDEPLTSPIEMNVERKLQTAWRAERTRKHYPSIGLPRWASHAEVVGHDGKKGWIVHLTRQCSSNQWHPVSTDLNDVWKVAVDTFENEKSALVRVEWRADSPVHTMDMSSSTTSVLPMLTLPATVPAAGLHLSSDWAFWIHAPNRLYAVSL